MLGNWIEHIDTSSFIQVNSVNINRVCNLNHMFSPIPLTAEIMPKLGFTEKHGEFPFYINYKTEKGFWISQATIDYDYGFCDRAGSFYCGDNHIETKSVHMLQNLHFITTGKHLQFEL